ERLRIRPLQGPDNVLVVMAQQALAGLGAGLLAGLGDVPAQQNPPVLAVDRLAVLRGGSLGEAPLRRERVEALARHRPDRDDPDPVLPGERHAGGANLRGDGEWHLLLQWQQLQCRVLEREPIALRGYPLALEEPSD